MPSIKELKSKQINKDKNQTPPGGLWSMLDEFKTMIPATHENITEEKDIVATETNQQHGFLKPCQEESVLFEKHTKPAIEQTENNKNNLSETLKKEPITNRQQSDNKVVTNRQQSDNKVVTNRQQKSPQGSETDNKVVTQPITQLVTNWQQSGNKVVTNQVFSSLVGLCRSLVVFFYNECKISRSKITNSLSLEYISQTLKKSPGSIKMTINRLEKKKIIERVEFKNGRGGWSKYSLPDLLFKELLQNETDNKLITNWQQSGNKVVSQPITQPITTSPVVSSSLINNIITTTNLGLDIPEGWQSLDLEPLQKIGFSQSHVIQIYREFEKNPNLALGPELIQDSIYALAFDLKHNNVEKDFNKPPAVVFTSLLKQGKPYACKTPDKFMTPLQEAMHNYQQAKTIQKQREQQMLKELQDTEFLSWQSELSEEKLLELCPEAEISNDIPVNIRKTMRRKKALELSCAYFETEIWPKKKQEILAILAKQKTGAEAEPQMQAKLIEADNE